MLASVQVVMTEFVLVSLFVTVKYQDGALTGTMPLPLKSIPIHHLWQSFLPHLVETVEDACKKVYMQEGWMKVEEVWVTHNSRWNYSSVLVCAFLYPLLKTFFTQDHMDFWLAACSGKMTWCNVYAYTCMTISIARRLPVCVNVYELRWYDWLIQIAWHVGSVMTQQQFIFNYCRHSQVLNCVVLWSTKFVVLTRVDLQVFLGSSGSECRSSKACE